MISHEEAIRWCETYGMRFYSYRTPEERVPMIGIGGELNMGTVGGEERWTLSGWFWDSRGKKEKVRVHMIGKTLEEIVELAQIKLLCAFDEPKKGSVG